jgi:hypothetical protein
MLFVRRLLTRLHCHRILVLLSQDAPFVCKSALTVAYTTPPKEDARAQQCSITKQKTHSLSKSFWDTSNWTQHCFTFSLPRRCSTRHQTSSTSKLLLSQTRLNSYLRQASNTCATKTAWSTSENVNRQR